MTNYQCYSYSAKAISNILNSNIKLTADTFYNELYHLWDFYSEEQIEDIVRKEEIEHDLF